MPTAANNPLLLAADAPSKLLPLLRSNPALAREQDAHGYSLLHALASYNQAALLRDIVREFSLDVNTVDEDGETALFVAETVEIAALLVQELDADWALRNSEGQTAEDKIREEGEFVVVADYLGEVRLRGKGGSRSVDGDIEDGNSTSQRPPPQPSLPDGVRLTIGSLQDEDQQEPDPEFRRRIEELAAREDFNDERGQAELRELVRDAVRDVNTSNRDVRQRFD